MASIVSVTFNFKMVNIVSLTFENASRCFTSQVLAVASDTFNGGEMNRSLGAVFADPDTIHWKSRHQPTIV